MTWHKIPHATVGKNVVQYVTRRVARLLRCSTADTTQRRQYNSRKSQRLGVKAPRVVLCAMPCRAKTIAAAHLDVAVHELKLMEELPLHRFEALLAPTARQVILRDLYWRRRGVPVQKAQHIIPCHKPDVFRANPEP